VLRILAKEYLQLKRVIVVHHQEIGAKPWRINFDSSYKFCGCYLLNEKDENLRTNILIIV
jgi:hypothetical protein